MTDVFSEPYALVEVAKDTREIIGGPVEIENFWGKPVERAKVAKREPLPAPEKKPEAASSKKNNALAKKVRRGKMVRKVEAKKSNQEQAGMKGQKEGVAANEIKLVKNKPRRRNAGNLAPVSRTRPFERTGAPVKIRSFR